MSRRTSLLKDEIPCHFLNKLAPKSIVMIKSARKMKNKTFAIDAAPSAIPPNPKMAAMIAMTKKITDQRNITVYLKYEKLRGRFRLLYLPVA